ncbi:MAG: MBL fold metallo-hydrolase, partial [Terriglobales bacterium]
MPYIQFLGAAGTVTGSKHLINATYDSTGKQGFQVLIDCGLFQGQKEWRERNWQDTPVPAREINSVVLTHAHLDHCGWIPRLVKAGFHGPIYATQPTIDLCSVVLPDSGHLQEEDAAFYNKRKASKHHPALPLYTLEEAQDCLRFFKPVVVGQTTQLSSELA